MADSPREGVFAMWFVSTRIFLTMHNPWCDGWLHGFANEWIAQQPAIFYFCKAMERELDAGSLYRMYQAKIEEKSDPASA